MMELLGWQWHQLDHMQTNCTSLQTDNHTDTSSLSFYRPDALPDTQPSVKALKAINLKIVGPTTSCLKIIGNLTKTEKL